MATLDLHCTDGARRDPSNTASYLAALILATVVGLPALLAPASPRAPEDFHGNSAGARVSNR